MEYDNSEKDLNIRYSFLNDTNAKNVFAKLDYLLRSGMHIQRDFPKPSALYAFLVKHHQSLETYYYDLFKMLLKKEGDGWHQYFFIDFHENSRGNVPSENQYRSYLKPEFILIGLIFFKIYKLDGNIEMIRISEFMNVLYNEYDDLLNKLQRIVSSINTDVDSDLNEERLTSMVKRAFNEFEQLGWISLDKDDPDTFTYQPSFERLRRIYYPQIENIDEIIKRRVQ